MHLKDLLSFPIPRGVSGSRGHRGTHAKTAAHVQKLVCPWSALTVFVTRLDLVFDRIRCTDLRLPKTLPLCPFDWYAPGDEADAARALRRERAPRASG
jgi:hypothetical protein